MEVHGMMEMLLADAISGDRYYEVDDILNYSLWLMEARRYDLDLAVRQRAKAQVGCPLSRHSQPADSTGRCCDASAGLDAGVRLLHGLYHEGYGTGIDFRLAQPILGLPQARCVSPRRIRGIRADICA
jgi:hypothetical protein